MTTPVGRFHFLIDQLLLLVNCLNLANLMVTVDVRSEEGDNPIWGLFHVQISSHLAETGTVMEQSQTHHGILSLPWRILKPGNLSRGMHKYDATTLQPHEFTANSLQRWVKDIVPISQGCNLLVIAPRHQKLASQILDFVPGFDGSMHLCFAEHLMQSDGNWAANIMSAAAISNPTHSFPLPPSVQSASAVEYLAQPAPVNIPTHSSHILASQPVPSSPGQTAGSAQVLINTSVDSPMQSVPPAQSTVHVHAPVLPHAHASSQLLLADQPGTQSQLDLLAYAAISNLSGMNVDAVTNELFSALRDHILGKEPEQEIIDVDTVDDPFTSEFLTIHGLLMADTHFRVGHGLGNGIERVVYDDLFATKLLASPYWVQVNSYRSISLPPIFSLNSAPLAEIETWVSGLLSMEPRQIMEPHHHIAEGGHNMHSAFALCLAQALLLCDDQFQSNAHPHYLAFKHGFNIKFSEGLYMCQHFFNGSVKTLICRMANRELNSLQDWIDSLMWPSDVNFEAKKKHRDTGDALLHAHSFHHMVMGSSLILTDPMWAISFRFSDHIPNSSSPEPKLILPLVVHSCTSEVEVILTKPMVNMLLERPDDRCPGESYFFDAWMHLQFALADSGEFSAF
ncbi:hypothetical protein K439DRAFT_1543176 [Ramaria rubella]|nr:hypothetical protein K439DRAFT_1543176 [Ramaria rubella]